MAKTAKLQNVAIDELIPYERNAKTHDAAQIEKLKKSIAEFGFLSPILIDEDMNIIAGHGRVLAARAMGKKMVPAVYIEGLTEEQRRAYILADNRLTELGGWDMDLVQEELDELAAADFDIDITGFEIKDDWFETRDKWDDSRQEGNEEYNEFLEKFEAKKTTDDCYTPDETYEAVANWVAKEYKVDRKNFVRPFYPGGDYQKEKYGPEAVVVDNPPFSILVEILRFYEENGVRFFLFAPTLTLFAAPELRITYIPTKCQVTYENGAKVNTSFITNMDVYQLRTAGELSDALNEAEKARRDKNPLPKYEYPSHIVTSTRAGRWTENGVDVRINFGEAKRVSALDAQKEQDKAIFGGGFLVSDRVAKMADEADRGADKRIAERTADRLREMADGVAQKEDGTIVWKLSPRELEIVKELGGAADV